MGISGWVWGVAGLVMTGMSGYIYWFVPKDGHPNSAMAFFFFIGIIFLIIGITKLFFRRMDDKSVFDSVKKSEDKNPETVIRMPTAESRPNKIDESINHMLRQQQTVKPESHAPQMLHASSAAPKQHMSHTNTYYDLHKYNGPVHNPSENVQANVQHQATHPAQQAPMHAQHHVQNVAEHSIKCRKCGNANPGHSNYCHSCGNGLR